MLNPNEPFQLIGHGLDAQVIRLKNGNRHVWTDKGRIERYTDALVYGDKSFFDFRVMQGQLIQHNLALHNTCFIPEPVAAESNPVVVPFDQKRRHRQKSK